MIQYAILALVFIVIVWDLAMLATKGYDHTLSWMIYQSARVYPIWVFLVGIVMGHILWPNSGPPTPTVVNQSTLGPHACPPAACECSDPEVICTMALCGASK